MATRYDYTGNEQTFTVTQSGYYTIEAAGAAGSGGNTYGTTYTGTGGKGARLVGIINLKAGDVIHIIVGGRGTCIQATAKDGSSGGGGGFTLITREIQSISDSRFQFTKNGQAFEVLMMVAGGGGSQDCAYRGSSGSGADGNASQFWSPDRYVAPSTASCASTSYTSNILSVYQYINQDAAGTHYTRNSGHAYGGYGGGGAADDSQSYGGGWASYATYTAGSWSLDPSSIGTDGCNNGDGYCIFTFAGSIYFGVSGKAERVKKAYVGVSGKARKVKKVYIGVNGIARKVYSDEAQ